jgi:hypothetical protein
MNEDVIVNAGASLRDMSRMTLDQQSHYAAAAEFALRRYPGPVGELIHRELAAYAEFGHRFATNALIPRLVRHVLTPPGPSADRDGAVSASTRATRGHVARRRLRGDSPAAGGATGGRSGASGSATGSTTLPPGFALWPRPARHAAAEER